MLLRRGDGVLEPVDRDVHADDIAHGLTALAEAAAVALLPVGGYCLAAAWRKDRAYLALATVPLLFGLQQVCEACVWRALDRGDAGAAEEEIQRDLPSVVAPH